MSGPLVGAVTLVLAAGLAAVVLIAVRPYAGRSPWWRLLPSLAPITLVAGAALVAVSGNG